MRGQALVALVGAGSLVACTGATHPIASSVPGPTATTVAPRHGWYANAPMAVSHDCRAIWVGELLTTARGLNAEWRQRRHHDPASDTVWFASIRHHGHRYRVIKCHDGGPIDENH